MTFQPNKVPREDIPLIIECMKERDRLFDEAKKLSDGALAEKWGCSMQYMNKLRIKYIGRRYN